MSLRIGVISDVHLKDSLGYADCVADRRVKEKADVLEAVRKAFQDVDVVVMNGDVLNSKHNNSGSIRDLTALVEHFHDKQVIVLGGNHDASAQGWSALDFLREMEKSSPWLHVYLGKPGVFEFKGVKLVLCPYTWKEQLNMPDNALAAVKLQASLPDGDVIFIHHALSDTETSSGQGTEFFDEIVLSRKWLENKYDFVVGGHIHLHQRVGNTVVVGSTFTNELGDEEGSAGILTVGDSYEYEHIKLPCRPIVKAVNPHKNNNVLPAGPYAIVKAVLTEKPTDEELTTLRSYLSGYDGHIIVEQYEGEREKVHFDEGGMDLSIPTLIKQYAKARGLDEALILKGYEIVS